MQAAAAAAAAAHLGALSSLRHALLGGLSLSLQGATCSGRETPWEGSTTECSEGSNRGLPGRACMHVRCAVHIPGCHKAHTGRRAPIHPWLQLTLADSPAAEAASAILSPGGNTNPRTLRPAPPIAQHSLALTLADSPAEEAASAILSLAAVASSLTAEPTSWAAEPTSWAASCWGEQQSLAAVDEVSRGRVMGAASTGSCGSSRGRKGRARGRCTKAAAQVLKGVGRLIGRSARPIHEHNLLPSPHYMPALAS